MILIHCTNLSQQETQECSEVKVLHEKQPSVKAYLIRPKECSKGKLNTVEKSLKHSSRRCSTRSAKYRTQKVKTSSCGIENSVSTSSADIFKFSNKLDSQNFESKLSERNPRESLDMSKSFHLIPQEPSTSPFNPKRSMPSSYQRKRVSIAKKTSLPRSKSMKMEKYEIKDNVNDFGPLLDNKPEGSILKSFDDLAAAMFQENIIKKPSTLLRQQTSVQVKENHTTEDQFAKINDIPDTLSKQITPSISKLKLGKLSGQSRQNKLPESLTRRTTFTSSNMRHVDKGQIDLEMIISAKNKASSIKDNLKMMTKKKKSSCILESASSETVKTRNSFARNIENNNEFKFEGNFDTTLQTHPIHNCAKTSSAEEEKPFLSTQWTIAIADPDGDVIEVNSNIKGSPHSKDDTASVCKGTH